MPNEEVRQLIDENKLDILLENDQLKKSQNDGKVFTKYVEGEITFGPTYKFDVHSDIYDTSEKARIPAWTDRILYCKLYPTNVNESGDNLDYGQIEFYGRAELRTSDHRPVVARINCEVLKVNNSKMEKIFDEVAREAGPQDASIIIDHEDGHAGFDNELLNKLFQLLVQIGGKIALTRFDAESLVIIFKNQSDTLKALENSQILSNFNSKLSVRLRTENWLEKIEEEFKLIQLNAIPLCTGNEINIDNEIDYFSTSIGPACDPASFCLDDDDLIDTRNISPNEESGDSNELIDRQLMVTPTKQIPIKPPPPRPAFSPIAPVAEKKAPVRPAPPPPKAVLKPNTDLLNATKKDDLSSTSSCNSESDLESSFSMTPPTLPAPRYLPSTSSEDEFHEDNLPPPPGVLPPAINSNSSFEASFDSHFNAFSDDAWSQSSQSATKLPPILPKNAAPTLPSRPAPSAMNQQQDKSQPNSISSRPTVPPRINNNISGKAGNGILPTNQAPSIPPRHQQK